MPVLTMKFQDFLKKVMFDNFIQAELHTVQNSAPRCQTK